MFRMYEIYLEGGLERWTCVRQLTTGGITSGVPQSIRSCRFFSVSPLPVPNHRFTVLYCSCSRYLVLAICTSYNWLLQYGLYPRCRRRANGNARWRSQPRWISVCRAARPTRAPPERQRRLEGRPRKVASSASQPASLAIYLHLQE